MSTPIKCSSSIRSLLFYNLRVQTKSFDIGSQFTRKYSHLSRKPISCIHLRSINVTINLESQRNNYLINKPDFMSIAWASTSSSSGFDLSPLNVSKINDELTKLSNDEVTSIIKGNASTDTGYTITDIDLSEFTAEIVNQPIVSESLLTATDIGLTWWAPTNLIFKSLTTLHEYLPWWGSIALLTMVLRICLFPVMVRNMKAQAMMVKNARILEEQRQKFKEAYLKDDQALQVNAAMNFVNATLQNNKNNFIAIAPMALTGVVFSSMFFALQTMAKYPIESMKNEGLFWFSNLTVADPYYILPALTSVSLYFLLTNGTETVSVDPLSAKIMKFMPMVLCPMILVVGAAFPAALNTYWLTNNVIGLVQGYLLRRPAIREKLQIPDYKAIVAGTPKKQLTNPLELKKDLDTANAIVAKVLQAQMSKNIRTRASSLKNKDESR